jgi:hypothetical protein
LNIKVDGNEENLDRLFNPILEGTEQEKPDEPQQAPSASAPEPSHTFPTKLNIVIHVIGSRGDVQPFIALGRVLLSHGHRVRLATHPAFKNFVEEHGIEFYSLGGDPTQLMAFMVKNRGLLPSVVSLRAGDIGKRRKDMAEIIDGCWRSCVDPGDGMEGGGGDWGDFMEVEDLGNDSGGLTRVRPFIADAIIANPPSFAHIHCAEKLRVPLHIIFTQVDELTQS